MYTIIQTLAWAFLFGIKLSPLAPSFPFFIICLIPLRKLLGKFYEEHELEEVSLGYKALDDFFRLCTSFCQGKLTIIFIR